MFYHLILFNAFKFSSNPSRRQGLGHASWHTPHVSTWSDFPVWKDDSGRGYGKAVLKDMLRSETWRQVRFFKAEHQEYILYIFTTKTGQGDVKILSGHSVKLGWEKVEGMFQPYMPREEEKDEEREWKSKQYDRSDVSKEDLRNIREGHQIRSTAIDKHSGLDWHGAWHRKKSFRKERERERRA